MVELSYRRRRHAIGTTAGVATAGSRTRCNRRQVGVFGMYGRRSQRCRGPPQRRDWYALQKIAPVHRQQGRVKGCRFGLTFLRHPHRGQRLTVPFRTWWATQQSKPVGSGKNGECQEGRLTRIHPHHHDYGEIVQRLPADLQIDRETSSDVHQFSCTVYLYTRFCIRSGHARRFFERFHRNERESRNLGPRD